MEELTPLLEKLAEKLGTTTEFLWVVLVRQAIISVYTDIGILILTIVMIYFFYRYVRYLIRRDKEGKLEGDDDTSAGLLLIAFSWGISVLIAFVYSLAQLSSIPTRLLNPDYWALQQILDLIR